MSHILQKDDYVNITLFGFSAGEELSSHSAPTPAILYFLQGEADVQLGPDTPGLFLSRSSVQRRVWKKKSRPRSRRPSPPTEDLSPFADESIV
ncbi:MAG: hypothetical protein WBQ06_10755 [Acidobacteriaceae bacterium]